MLALIVATLSAIIFFVWTGRSEHEVFTPSPDETTNETVVTSGDNPEGIHDLPVPDAVTAARNALAEYLSVDEPKSIVVLTAFEIEWPDACLGFPQEDEMCAQVITPGYDIVLQYKGIQYRYHTNNDGSALRAAQ